MCDEARVGQEGDEVRVWYPVRFPWARGEEIDAPGDSKTLVSVDDAPLARLREKFGVMADCLDECWVDDQIPVYHVEGVGDFVALEHLDWLGRSALRLNEIHGNWVVGREGPACDPSCKALAHVCMLRHCGCLTKTDSVRSQSEASHE